MDCKDLIRISLEQSRMYVMGLLNDMRDAPTAVPTPRGGNHPLWVLGHLVYSEAGLVARFIEGRSDHPLQQWAGLFGGGSEPVADASRYPSFDELLAEFEKIRARTLQVLAGMSDADLEGPAKAPPGREAFFGTRVKCFLMIATHTTFHGGEVADARRAIGRKPVFA